MQERKMRYRIRMVAIIMVKEIDGGRKTALFHTENISISGALIKCAYEPLDVSLLQGDRVDLMLQLPAIDSGSHELSCPGNIVRETVEGFYGVKFDLDEPARRFLQGYLGKFVAQFPEAII
jgi:hypothetical protein